MDERFQIEALKALLRHEVAVFCQHNERKWKSEISKTIDEIKANNWPAVFFGGTLRSLLISRITRNTIGRPRDVDIVVRGIHLTDLRRQFEQHISRETRFGGVQLSRRNWQFDLWPLDKTFAFSNKQFDRPGFFDLPRSTFLNIEAVAMDVWPQLGKPRTIYSGDDQFFKGILSQTIEINYEENPFPDLCVARALVTASNLQWKVGRRLLQYVMKHGAQMSEMDFEEVQRKHYGAIKLSGAVLQRVLDFASERVARSTDQSFELPLPKQLSLWSDDHKPSPRFRFTVVAASNKSKKKVEVR